jgi:hypothetical protein
MMALIDMNRIGATLVAAAVCSEDTVRLVNAERQLRLSSTEHFDEHHID